MLIEFGGSWGELNGPISCNSGNLVLSFSPTNSLSGRLLSEDSSHHNYSWPQFSSKTDTRIYLNQTKILVWSLSPANSLSGGLIITLPHLNFISWVASQFSSKTEYVESKIPQLHRKIVLSWSDFQCGSMATGSRYLLKLLELPN